MRSSISSLVNLPVLGGNSAKRDIYSKVKLSTSNKASKLGSRGSHSRLHATILTPKEGEKECSILKTVLQQDWSGLEY